MSSILNNVSAQNALRTLQATNKSLETTSDRISSGLKVATASDNAAYWSIATTMKSDSSSLGAVTDSLSLGANIAKSTYNGLDQAKDLLGKIKDKLTTAAGEGVDRAAVQEEINALQEQLKTAAGTSSFSGQNWLDVGTTGSKSIVSSISRDANNKLDVGTIDVNTADYALYTTADGGILDKQISIDTTTATGAAATFAAATFDADDEITFSIAQNGGIAKTVTINQAVVNDALSGASVIETSADLKAVFEKALANSDIQGISVEVDDATKIPVFSSTEDFDMGGATAGATTAPTLISLGLATTAPTKAAATVSESVDTIDITGATTADVTNYLKIVDEALTQVTTAASKLGAVQTRIDTQKTLVSSLTDTIDAGVSSLIDADMEEESTRLKALQTQQQLGVQALSIANSSSQNVLSLFR
ncbi:MAG: flagellin C [Rhizobiales bacterium]|jgi:flagellin|nr:flagellin C [Hyphomicrobiales bacterium]